MVKPLCPLANRFCGCFVWAPAPFFVSLVCCCLFCCFLWRNASLAGGFAGRRGLVVLCVFLVILLRFACSYGPTVSLYKRLFDSLCSCKDRALARHRPNSRKKKARRCVTQQKTHSETHSETYLFTSNYDLHCACCLGWIRFAGWTGRGEGSQACLSCVAIEFWLEPSVGKVCLLAQFRTHK